jgi:SAM-dependent methyltransferase
MAFDAPPTSYDEIPYASDPYPRSHPDHLATVAVLFGMAPPPVDRCRVLELGCARGGNLIPMAVSLPRGRFVGIDSSAHQVSSAREVIAALGLGNIAVEHLCIRDVDAGLGTFDYIICHGTYSWVPAEVQDGILAVCARNLAPDGLAYVSYNTYPGWHLRGLVRDLLCYHVRRYPRPRDRAAQARAVLDFMARSVSAEERAYSNLLKEEYEYICNRPDSYLLHDHLEEVNDPIYFHQFVARAEARGLRFVSEVQGSIIAPDDFPPTVAETLHRLSSDAIEMEQFLDFLIDRKFRQSLLCRDTITPAGAPQPDRLARLFVAAQPQAPHRPASFAHERLTRAALQHLYEVWPRVLPFGALLDAARTRLGAEALPGQDAAGPDRDAQDLAEDLLRCFHSNLVELHTAVPPFALELSERPVASPLARLQAAAGTPVTNLRHEAGQLSAFGSHVLRHLDGRNDRAALLEILVGLARKGDLGVPEIMPDGDGGAPRDDERLREVLGPSLDACLLRLARFALLVG